MSGWRKASSWAIIPPIEKPTIVADRAPTARITSRDVVGELSHRERRRRGARVSRPPVVDPDDVERALEMLDEDRRATAAPMRSSR